MRGGRDETPGVRMLEEYLDMLVLVEVRKGTWTCGILRSFDQYYNLLLEDASEILLGEGEYAMRKAEVCLIRGENVISICHADCRPVVALPEVEYNTLCLRKAQEERERRKEVEIEDLDYIDI